MSKELEVNTPSVFMNAEKFSTEVERRHLVDPKCTLLEHATTLLDEMGIDASDAQSLVSKSLRERIYIQSSELHLVKEKITTMKLKI